MQQAMERAFEAIPFAADLLAVVILLDIADVAVDVASEPDAVQRRR
jgi:hypothetical protein